jgi:uncharacterized protein
MMKTKSNSILQQLFSIPLDDEKYLIYAPLKRIAFIGNTALVNTIHECCLHSDTPDLAANGPGRLDFLHRLDFFKPEPHPHDEYRQRGIQYDAVILFLTNQCNLRCTYCYASSGKYRPRRMSWEVARSGIDFVMDEVIKNRSSVITLGFHGGGEPTLNWDVTPDVNSGHEALSHAASCLA